MSSDKHSLSIEIEFGTSVAGQVKSVGVKVTEIYGVTSVTDIISALFANIETYNASLKLPATPDGEDGAGGGDG